MKSKIVYWLTYAGMWLVALLPFRALYALSDGLYFLMRHVVHYRKKVVRRNLRNSFPEKSETELMEIERKFYHYICDYMLEEVKMLRMSFEELCRRMKYDNKEEYLAMIEKHGGIVLLIPHYANFEWIIGMGAIMHPGDIPVQVYKPLSNKYLDEMFKHIRARFGGYNVAKHSTAREVIKLRREGRRIAIGLITDQSPNRSEAHYWTTFLNQDTVFMDGAERIAKLMDFPVFYCELERTSRGYCKVLFDLVTETPKQTADGEITECFARRLEQTIRREPAYWFWSHKRWKNNEKNLCNMDKIAVVILNWNGCDMLRSFLPSVVRFSGGGWCCGVCGGQWLYGCFCGNAPSRVSFCALDSAGREPRFLADGYNLALKQVEAEYVVLLNSDVEVTEHWLVPLAEYMDAYPETAACQPEDTQLA